MASDFYPEVKMLISRVISNVLPWTWLLCVGFTELLASSDGCVYSFNQSHIQTV